MKKQPSFIFVGAFDIVAGIITIIEGAVLLLSLGHIKMNIVVSLIIWKIKYLCK